jgi:hypothetical protein
MPLKQRYICVNLYFKLKMLWHDDFFTQPSGQEKTFLKTGRFEGHFIVQHPYFHFGSSPFQWRAREKDEDEPKVFFQQFEIDTTENFFDIDDFLINVEKNYHLRPDEVLWYETGFWTIVLDSNSFMGMGLNRLKETLKGQESAKFAVCLSNDISVILMNSKMSEENKILVNVYASNDIIPFVEVVEPFRKAIRKYDSSKSLISEILPERKLLRFWSARRRIGIYPEAFVIDRKHDDYKRLPVIKNPFTNVRDPVISKIRYATGTTIGGFIESDYYGGRQFYTYADIWELASASIVEFHFE